MELVKEHQELVSQYWNFPQEYKGSEKHYDELAEKYDFILQDICGYNDPDHVTICAKKYLKQDSKILDVGCGTGILADTLKKDGGFTEFWGIDGSQKMLDLAVPKKLYHETKKILIGLEPMEPTFLNRFDGAVATGCYLDGHFSFESFKEIIPCLVVGGVFIFSMRDLYFTEGQPAGYKEEIDRLCKEGIIEIAERYNYVKYAGIKKDEFNRNFEEKESSVFILRRLK